MQDNVSGFFIYGRNTLHEQFFDPHSYLCGRGNTIQIKSIEKPKEHMNSMIEMGHKHDLLASLLQLFLHSYPCPYAYAPKS